MTPPEEPVKLLGVECLQCENQTKHLCNDCGVCLLCCDCDDDCDDYGRQDPPMRRKTMMTPLETDNSLRVKIGYLETRNAYEHYDLTSQVEALQKQVEMLEAELEERPVVWAIQHIETKTLANRGDSVDLYASVEAAESAIRTEFEPSEHQVAIYTGRHIQ